MFAGGDITTTEPYYLNFPRGKKSVGDEKKGRRGGATAVPSKSGLSEAIAGPREVGVSSKMGLPKAVERE